MHPAIRDACDPPAALDVRHEYASAAGRAARARLAGASPRFRLGGAFRLMRSESPALTAPTILVLVASADVGTIE